MDRTVTNTTPGKNIPPHEFVLMELIGLKKLPDGKYWDYDNAEKKVVGYAQRNPLSKFDSFNIVTVDEATGDIIPTDLVIDSRKDGNMAVKVRGEETVTLKDGTVKTYPYTSLATLFFAAGKDTKAVYYRGNAYPGKAWDGRVLRMFSNDGTRGIPRTAAGGTSTSGIAAQAS